MLFDALRTFHSQHKLHQDTGAERGLLSFPARDIDAAARILFENLSQGGITVTALPSGCGWTPDAGYFEAARDAARRGAAIVRLFLLPYRHYLSEPDLIRHWLLDTTAGINVQFCVSGDGFDRVLPPSMAFGALDFGLWDGEVVSYTLYNRASVGRTQLEEWRLSRRLEDIEVADRKWTEMLGIPRLAVGSPGDTATYGIYEPIRQTSSFAYKLSSCMCRQRTPSCSWLHGSWQYLRMLGMVETPAEHSPFFLKELSNSPEKGGSPRILICGPRDYSLVAYAIQAANLQKQRTPPRLAVTDECETPLVLSGWLAAQANVAVDLIRQAPRTLTSSSPYDVIVSCDFLSRLCESDKASTIKNWYTSLGKGGRVVATAQVGGTDSASAPLRTDAEGVEAFADRAFRLASLWKSILDIPPTVIAAMAREYAANRIIWPFRDEQHIAGLFSQQGFSVCTMSAVSPGFRDESAATSIEMAMRKT